MEPSRPPFRRRTPALIVVATALIAVAVVLGLDRSVPTRTSMASPSPSAATSLASPVAIRDEATSAPTIEHGPTLVPESVHSCSVDDLAFAAGGWGGATGSMAGGATLINVSLEPCRVVGTPAVALLAGDRVVIADGAPPSPGLALVLLPGGVANVITVWSNWCGDPPERPLSLRLSLVDEAGALEAPVVVWSQPGVIGGPGPNSVPRCDIASLPSTIGASAFAAAEPPEPNDSREECSVDELAAYLGTWGAAAGTSYANVVVFNRAGVDCAMATSPVLELRDADGTIAASAERWVDPDSTFDLPAGWAAITAIGFADWCVAPPKLPLRLDLRIGTDPLAILPTSAHSRIFVPTCNSGPATPPPSLGYTGPFTIPGA